VLSNEIDRINGILSNTERENSDLKMNIVGYNQLRIRYEEQLALMVIIFAEVESLRSRVKEKEREVEEVRRSSLAPYRRWVQFPRANNRSINQSYSQSVISVPIFVWLTDWLKERKIERTNERKKERNKKMLFPIKPRNTVF
jgi:hypothetical protein